MAKGAQDGSAYALKHPTKTWDDLAYLTGYDFYYDFAVDGGAVATPVTLRGDTPIPSGFVVVDVFKEIQTALDSAAHTATAALKIQSANDLFTATIVSNAMWTTLTTVKAAITVKTTAVRTPILTLAVQDLTVGKFTIHIVGYPAPAA